MALHLIHLYAARGSEGAGAHRLLADGCADGRTAVGAEEETGHVERLRMGLEAVERRGRVGADLGAVGHAVVAFADSLPLLVEGLADDGVFTGAAGLLGYGAAAVAVDGVGQVDPSHAVAAELLLEELTQVGRHDVVLNKRVAEISDAYGAVHGLHAAQCVVEMAHAAGCVAGVVDDGFDALRPYFLEVDGLARAGLGDGFGFRRLGCGDDAACVVVFLRHQVAEDVDAPQFGSANMQLWQGVHDEQKEDHQSCQHKCAFSIFH